jgi:hypothetical protein
MAVGRSGWDHIVEYRGDPAAALADLRAATLASGDYFWDDSSEEYIGPRPTSLAELDALRESDEYWEIGTHSVLDVDRLIGSREPDRDGTVRQLTDEEAVVFFGTSTPTREQFEAAAEPLPDVEGWSGFCQLLYADDRPTEIAFWGATGD